MNLVMEYHYSDGDVGAYPVEPQDNLQSMIENAFKSKALGPTVFGSTLTHIIFREATPEENENV